MERYSLNHFVRTLSIFLLCVMFTATAFAQQKTIKGTVVDATGEPLIGVNVSVKGTTIDYRIFLHRLSNTGNPCW